MHGAVSQLLPQRLARDAQQLRRPGALVVGRPEGSPHVLKLELAKGHLERTDVARARRAREDRPVVVVRDRRRQVLEVNVLAPREDQRVLDRVGQLSNVAGEGVLDQGCPGPGRHLGNGRPRRRETLDEMSKKERQIAGPVAERRQVNLHEVQLVDERFVERPVLDPFGRPLMSRGDDPRLHLHRAVAAKRLEGPLAKHPHQLALDPRRELCNLVEKERAAVRRLELSVAPLDRPRKGPPLVSKELSLDQVVGQRATIDDHEGLRTSRALVVNQPRDDLLAGAAFSRDQHRQVAEGDHLDRLADPADAG